MLSEGVEFNRFLHCNGVPKLTLRNINWRLRFDRWNIGVVRAPIASLFSPDAKPNVEWFPEPAGDRFFADPFLATKQNKSYILCEEYDYRLRKGRIVSFEFPAGLHLKPEVAIEQSFHMSYPYTIEYDGDVYCIPETKRAREISLYKAEDFPRKWMKVATLIDNFAGVDSTVFRYNDRWWLASSTGGKYSALNLLIWHAASLFGPWEPHVSNPVKVDIASCRPAGTPFEFEGNLYRPAQDCSGKYGGRIVLNRVVRLTPTEFKEEVTASLEPFVNSPYRDGIHTVCGRGNFTIIDGNRRRFSMAALKDDLMRKLVGSKF